MKFVDYYKVMGLSDQASAEEIKKVYRRLARKYHPDVSKEADAEAKFKQLGEAYEVLKDPEKRAEYDELRKYGSFRGEDFAPPPDWRARTAAGDTGYNEADPRQFSEFFEAIFGRAGAAGGDRHRAGFALRGEDIHYRIPVSLEESATGASRAIALQVHGVDAQGRFTPETKTLRVTIPAGVTDGQRIRLKGQGHPGLGDAPAGDLYLHVDLQPHPWFTVEGRDLSLMLPVAPWEAVLGSSVNVPTLSGVVKLSIPANAKAGQKLRLKGKGLPGKPPGDLYAVLQIALPEVHTADERELFRALARRFTFNPRARLGV